MKQAIRVMIYAATGLYDRVREEIDELIKRGELKEHERTILLEAVDARETEAEDRSRLRSLQEKLEVVLQEVGRRRPAVPSQMEMESIRNQLEELKERIERLERLEPAASR